MKPSRSVFGLLGIAFIAIPSIIWAFEPFFFQDGLPNNEPTGEEKSADYLLPVVAEGSTFSPDILGIHPLQHAAEPSLDFPSGVQQDHAENPNANPLDQAKAYIRQSEHFIRKGRPEKALPLLEKAFALAPTSTYVQRRVAGLAAAAGAYRMADNFFHHYISSSPEDKQYLVGWAAVKIRLAQYEAARNLLAEALRIDPVHPLAQLQLAALDIRAGRPPRLTPYWKEIDVGTLIHVAEGLIQGKKIWQDFLGRDGYTRLVDTTMGPGTEDRLTFIVEALRAIRAAAAKEDWIAAERASEGLIKINLHSFHPRMARAQCLFQLGRLDESLGVLSELREHYPDAFALWFNSGLVYLQLENYAQAVNILGQAVVLQPGNIDAALAQACAYAGAGRAEEVWPIVERCLRVNPTRVKERLRGATPYLKAIQRNPRVKAILFGADA